MLYFHAKRIVRIESHIYDEFLFVCSGMPYRNTLTPKKWQAKDFRNGGGGEVYIKY